MTKVTFEQMLNAGVHFGHLKESGIQVCLLIYLTKRKEFTL